MNEPVWLDGLALELIARACVRELGVAVRLPWTWRRLHTRTVELWRGAARPDGSDPLEWVSVVARDEKIVSRLLQAPRLAWLAGERAPAGLALALCDAIASAQEIRGDRTFLAALAVLFFLDINGWLIPSRGRQLVLSVRRLAGDGREAAARELSKLVRPGQRLALGSS